MRRRLAHKEKMARRLISNEAEWTAHVRIILDDNHKFGDRRHL
jgi:hypothetical protein